MIILAAHAHRSDTWLALTGPVPPGRMIQVGQVGIRVYDCKGTGPYVARLGFGYEAEGEEHYYPIPIGTSYPAGTLVRALESVT